MLGPYSEAIEKQLEFRRWLETKGASVWSHYVPTHVRPMYLDVLRRANTFYMDRHFCELVDHARKEVPDDLTYDATWLHAPAGFMWLASPFDVPRVDESTVPHELMSTVTSMDVRICAVGWHPVRVGDIIRFPDGTHKPAGPGVTQFVCFISYADYDQDEHEGFGPWSYFALRDGDLLKDRLVMFEISTAHGTGKAKYVSPDARLEDVADRLNHSLHEVRWVFTALYMMAQRLSTQVEHRTDRSIRRRAERSKETVPEFVRVITLRRMQQARQRDGAEHAIDWQWQWAVRGFWRNQWFPSIGIHRPVFVESYIKGPAGKPLKPDTSKLFVARR